MDKIKVYVVGPSTGYARFIKNRELVDDMKDAQVVLFTGGEDINPNLYHCKKHPRTYYTKSRDDMEVSAYKKVRPDQLIVGVCRGGQLSTAMNGGLLVQHCTGHAVGCSHTITNGNVTYQIASIHHQMMYPWTIDKKNYDVMFWSNNNLSDRYEGDKIDPQVVMNNGEPEIILYHTPGQPKSIAIQGHPEMAPDSPVSDMINELIDKYVNK